MSQIYINIKKFEITPRNKLIKDRFIIKLKLKAIATGYVFTRNVFFDIKPFEEFSKLLSKIKMDSIKKGISEEMIEELVRFYEEQKIDERRIGEIKDFANINKNIIIPASSFKGAIRSRIEYKLKPYKVGNEYYSFSCFSVLGPYAGYSDNHKAFWGEEILLNKQSCSYDEEESPYVCIVCDMFGAPGLSSRYFFSDLRLVKGETEVLNEKYGIKAIKPNSEFEGEIIGFNSNYVELGILFAGLELYTQIPVLIGAYKYQHIPKIGKPLFRKNQYFGTLRFSLIEYEPKNIAKDIGEILRKSKEALEKQGIVIDYEVGKIE